MRAADFFAFARERHAIYLRRQAGEPEPWTEDPILSVFRFTNVFRELDRTTVWFRKNVREKLAAMSAEQQLLGTILFRTLNRIESGEVLFNVGQLVPRLDPVGWRYLEGKALASGLAHALRQSIPTGPWVTGAYIVKTPDGMDKLTGALWIVEEARKRARATVLELEGLERSPASLEALHSRLVQYPFLGPFTAYEIVSDLRWLPILHDAPDIMTWACAGPGAIRGLHRVHDRDYRKGLRQPQACHEMQEILALSSNPDYWPQNWPAWEMREVEHTLCEFDKHQRVASGQGTPRGRFR